MPTTNAHDCSKCYKPIKTGAEVEAFGVMYHQQCAPKTRGYHSFGAEPPVTKKSKKNYLEAEISAADRAHEAAIAEPTIANHNAAMNAADRVRYLSPRHQTTYRFHQMEVSRLCIVGTK